MLYLWKSVKREYSCKILSLKMLSSELSLNTIMISLGLILIGAVKKPNKLSAVISFMASVTKENSIIKRKTKRKQSNSSLTLQGSYPPCNSSFRSISAKKVTFTQTRVHKYLSVRTQMDDIFRGSSLYATSQLQFLHEDKEMGCCGWHSGFGRTP